MTAMGASNNLALFVFRVPDFIFWLKEGVLSMSYMLFFATPFLHNEVLRKLDLLPIGFLEVPLFLFR
jgi:hypothetical protein